MITFASPLFLAVGAGLAAVVLALHLLSPRPPRPAPLPTARFLRPAPRDRIRWHRRPADAAVLALRVAVALLLGALCASPRWAARLEPGTTRIVLLDGGLAMADRWGAALAAARARAADATEVRGAVFDASGWRPVASEEWAALPAPLLDGDGVDPTAGAGPHDGSYLVALRALRTLAADARTVEVEAELVTHPRWGAWDAALGALRPVAWPGRIRLVTVPDPTAPPGQRAEDAPDRPIPVARRTAATPAHVVAALQALGYALSGTYGGLWVLEAADDARGAALEAAAAGDTVVVAGPDPAAPPDGPLAALWDPARWPAGDLGGAIRTPTRSVEVEDAGSEPLRGAAVPGAAGRVLTVVAADGRPLAAAAPLGAGCLVRYGAPLAAGALDPDFPRLVRTLADGCRPAAAAADATPLDRAAVAALGGGGPERVPTEAVRAGAGTPLEGWLLLALALAAAAETVLVARLRRTR